MSFRKFIEKSFILPATMVAAVLAHSAAHAALQISTKPTANMSCNGGVCSSTAKMAVLNVNDLANMLASSDVTVKSDSRANDIEVDAALSWATTSRLTLDSHHSIAFNRPIEVAGTGALTIITNDGSSAGDFRFFSKGRVEFWDLESSLIVNSKPYVLVGDLKQLDLDIRHDPSGLFALAKSISVKNHNYSKSPIDHTFEGVFEGLGNTIAQVRITSTSLADTGLFSRVVMFSAVIRDIGLVSANITAKGTHVGALVGSFEGGAILNSYASGQITSSGAQYVGGLVGIDFASAIANSHSDVAITQVDNGTAGGLVGYLHGDCSSSCFGTIESSYATGKVTGANSSIVGGLVGYSFGGVIANSYETGAVSTGEAGSVGGLIGSNVDDTDVHTAPIVTTSYSTGLVTGGSGATIGGLFGQDVADAQNASDYWDLDTSGISDPSKGAGNIANDHGLSGLSDAELKSGLPVGFDKKIWRENPGQNNGYPYLIDNSMLN